MDATMNESEEWRDIPGYEGSYQASTLGRVRSLTRVVELNNDWADTRWQYGKVLKPAAGSYLKDGTRDPRLSVVLRKYGKSKTMRVHVLVALSFLGERPEHHDVAHNNGDNTDNRLVNLRYATRSENELDKFVHGTRAIRDECAEGHKLAGDNLRVEKSGQRNCVTCSRVKSREYYRRKRAAESV